MLITEFRIPLPITVAEYQVAQLYNVAKTSKENSNASEGIEIVKNEPFHGIPLFGENFDSGQYTYKIYHLESKVPSLVRRLFSSESMSVHEEAYNAFPYCRTILTNPTLGGRFNITIETMHLDDEGTTENAHCLAPELLKKRKVQHIDIVNSSSSSDDSHDYDPTVFKSVITGRGPLDQGWQTKTTPIMTCYKLVKVEFRVFGLQGTIENWILSAEEKLFLKFHRQLFCTTDEWYGMTMEDIRKMEEEIRNEINSTLQTRSINARNTS